MAQARRDANRVTAVLGVSNVDGETPIIIYADPTTNRLLVNATITGTVTTTAGTEYTEGDIDATITGGAIMWEDAADTLRAVSAAKPLPVELKTGTASIGTLAANSGVDIGDVTINNAAGASAVNIQDGGNIITVDGTVAATQSGTWVLGANSGVDIGDVTINNAAGASAVNIQDGGNSITIDGTVSVSGAVDTELPAAAALADGASATPTTPTVGVIALLMNATTVDRQRAVVNALDSTGTGIAAVGIVGQLDDVAASAVTENQFATVRITSLRALHVQAQANSGVDIGDVTINNASGASAVNIQDGGNTITVDGTVAISGTVTVDSELAAAAALSDNFANPTTSVVGAMLMAWDGTTWDRVTNGGGVEATALRVTIANDSTGVLSVDDNAGSLTVDGTVAVSSITTSVTPGTAAANLGKAEDAVHTTGDVGVMALGVANEANTARAADGDYLPPALDTEGNVRIIGNRDHDAVDAGEIVGVGGRAIAHGTNPTAVAAADRTAWYFNRAGVPFVIGGHPNIVTLRTNYTAAQTDAALVTVAGGLKIVVTRCSVLADKANTVDVQARVGFGATTTPTGAGTVLSHPGIAAGSGVIEGNGSGIIGVGADGEDLRITSEVPTTGSIDVMVSYYTIES